MAIHESAENYLETILMLSKERPVVRAVDIANELDFKKSNSFCSNSHSCSKSVPLLLCRTPLSCECLFYFLVYGSFSLPSSISRVFLFSFLFFAVLRFFCAKSAHSG